MNNCGTQKCSLNSCGWKQIGMEGVMGEKGIHVKIKQPFNALAMNDCRVVLEFLVFWK